MVVRKFGLALMTRPSGVNSITAMERPMALSRLSLSCSCMTRWLMSDATLITLVTCRCSSSTGI
ncbi:hypothetical protein D3C79_1064340 [compost metagenome]